MKSIYNDLLNAADQGKKFKVDLINKSLWINRRLVIKKGEIYHEEDKSKDLIIPDDLANHFGSGISKDPWELLEIISSEFEKSVPGKNETKSYFKAKSVDELTDADLAYNYDRNFAVAMLEGFILLAGLAGILKWQNPKHWFWQSSSNKNFVVLRNYIELHENKGE